MTDGKPSFKISDCVMHSSGALLFRERDGLRLDNSLRIQNDDPSLELPFGSPQALVLSAKKGKEGKVAHAMIQITLKFDFDHYFMQSNCSSWVATFLIQLF